MGAKKGAEIKLNVRPVFIEFNHLYVYEGPCRFGKGDTLEPTYDRMISGELYKQFVETLENHMPEEVNLLEPVHLQEYTDEFKVYEDEIQKALQDSDKVDLYLISTSGRATRVTTELARRCKKPVAFYSKVLMAVTTNIAALHARNIEAYPAYDWKDFTYVLKALRIRKVLANTRMLVLNRFASDVSPVSAQDCFLSLEEVSRKLNVQYHFLNVHEFLDQLTVRKPDQNPTTPGRNQQNITDEEEIQIDRMTDELIAHADACYMEKEMLKKSVRAYYLVQKLLKYWDCNAFTAPCPDMCSTRRLNQEQCTLCLTHSLNEESGIPSACEYDMNALLSKLILQNLSGKSTYMGNTCLLPIEDGKITIPDFAYVSQEEVDQIKDIPNLIVTLHSVASRKLKGWEEVEAHYEIRPFAHSGWGGTIRYDFSRDADTTVTLLRIDPTCSKMLVATSKIKGQFGFKNNNCTMAMVQQMEDAKNFFEQQLEFGSHMAVVYGDYTQDLLAVGKVLGLEVVLAK